MSPGRYVFGPVTWYGFLIFCGMALAIFLAHLEARRKALPNDTVIDLALLVIPCGLIGARLYYVLFTLDLYLANPVRILFLWEGGLAIYGGLIAGAAAIAVYTRRKRLSLARVLDALSPGVVLAQAIGRWGNFFNSEAYGQLITDPAWQFFPFGVLIGGSEAPEWHQATFFYESAWDLGVFAALWLTRRRMRRDGDTFLWYMLLYAAGRQLVEGLRTDSLYAPIAGLRISQALAVAICLAVIAVFFLRAFKKRKALSCALLAASVLIPPCALLLFPAQPLVFSAVFLAAGIGCGAVLYRAESRGPDT